jgi:superfamily II DNA or RNA helicase
MTDKFINPITLSFELLARHKGLLRDTLSEQGLQSDDIDEILESMEVDRGLFLSINPRHAVGKASFRQFCTDHGLAYELPDALGWLPDARLYVHQEEAIRHILAGETTVLATGTGSGKTEAFLIPILDHCLKRPGPGVKALIIYPMNALANDQIRRFRKVLEELHRLVPGTPVTLDLFTGSTSERERDAMRRDPPDILITNYVMLDWMLARSKDQPIFAASSDSLRYIVLDEIHTYRGNKATHLRYLLARLKARLTGPVVQIGTSATLQTDPTRGYLHSDGDRLGSFIKPLLDVEEYSFVTTKFEAELDAPPDDAPLPVPSDADELGWALEADTTTGLENLGRLTGQTYASWDLVPQNMHGEPPRSKVFRDMQQNRFVVELKRSLSEHGAQSFGEIVRLLTSLLPPSHPLHNVEQVAKAYLSAIAFANHLQVQYGQPLLDFRAHLFLRNIGGYLKRCIKCHKYHSGKQEFCQDCGFPLFCVYRHDVHQCVGKVSGNRLKWELYPESTDRKNAYYVLISSATEAQGGDTGVRGDDMLGFRGARQLDRDEIVLDYEAYGRLRLELLPWLRYDEVSEHIIPLVDGTQDHRYLHNLVRAVLDFQPHQRKKLLGFIDNREQASRYASVLQDEFADEFFEEYLKFCKRHYLPGEKTDLVTVLTILHRHVPNRGELSPAKQALFDELDIWYRRYVCKPPRLFRNRKNLLQLKDPGRFTDFERELLGAFITERAIAKSHQGDRPEGRYIRFMTHLATDHKGMYYEASQSSDDPAYPSISLSKQAREYGDLVSLRSPEEIAGTVEDLVQRGVLCAGETSDGKTHYYIDPHQVLLNVPPSDDDEYRNYDEYNDLREQLLLTAAVHSSEVRPDKREEIEAAFHDSALNVVMATPTLEMGIDIGQLENVLMVGVPPLPSNYAQRAGRAGRGSKNNFALIVTFCSEHDEHDSYYFHRPRQMINGVVSPPAFNPHNIDIISKHVNAFMLAGHLDSRQALERLYADVDARIERRVLEIRDLFGTDAEAYLRDAFKQELARALDGVNGNSQRHFYATGFFPDYSFRRDQVYVVDADDADTLARQEPHESLLADRALSEREPELAYYRFSPGETVFMAGDVYLITPEGEFETICIADETLARSYRYFEASRQVRYATKRKVYRRYGRDESFVNDGAFVSKGRVLEVAFFPECRLFFVNRGCLDFDNATDPFSDEDGQRFKVGYEVRRQAIVLRFDASVCADEKLYLSLVSALDRTIKDEYCLDESEIRLLVDVRPQPADPPGVAWIYVVLYDTDGNGNVPLEEIFQDFDGVVEAAHRRMQDCAGTPDQPCEAGCYLCIRSYTTRRFAGSVDKQIALMFTSYLLGQGKFRPAIAEPPPTVSQFDLTLRLERHGDAFAVRAPSATYSAPLDDDQNVVIFNLLSRAVRSEFSEGMRTLKVIARDGYIVNAINDGSLRQNKDAFARFQFELLRFRQVKAEKG